MDKDRRRKTHRASDVLAAPPRLGLHEDQGFLRKRSLLRINSALDDDCSVRMTGNQFIFLSLGPTAKLRST